MIGKRAVLAIAVLASTTSASADPEPAWCGVSLTLSQVSDEVREVVASWLRDVPACGSKLEVSIEATAAGYVVTARDAHGRRRLRLVPDADTLGALIASWSADDRVSLPAAAPPSSGGPAPDRWLGLSGAAGSELGVRIQMDLRGGAVPVGVAIATQTDGVQPSVQAILYSGVDLDLGAHALWHGRLQVGAGVRINDPRFTGDRMDGSIGAAGFDIATAGSLTVSRDLGRRWALSGGLAVDVTLQTYRSQVRLEPQPPVPLAVVGISCRL
jgi:hypothetical protein